MLNGKIIDYWRVVKVVTFLKIYSVFEIRGFHGSEDIDVGLLGCNAVWTCR
jgi:hypothetical protein